VNDAEYRALDAVNYSTLKHIRKSPKHYKHALENPDTSTNYAMLRAIHALVLEPFSFDEAFVVWDGRRDKRNKDYAAFLEKNVGKDVLNPEELAKATAISEAYRASPFVEGLLAHAGTRYEVPMVWTDFETGLVCKGKPDIICVRDEGDGLSTLVIADLKTFFTTEARQIVRQAHQLGWLLQLAHYTRGAIEHFELLERFQAGQLAIEWWSIICEEEAPHDCSAFGWTQAEQGRAQAQLSVMLQTLQDCRATDRWPGRGEVQAQQDNVNEQEG
jgi:hypothetical protein